MRGRTTRWLPTAIWQTTRTPDERVRADLDAVLAAASAGALAAAGVDHEVRVFDGVGHAFVTTADAIARDPVQGEAWGLLRAFLRRTIGS
ncbi:MAG: dienelactone hydrolase family protein [Trueperaceae bacterium]|nr:dienelactone hydrolase family protein [Trueperaceae bacterium]